MKTQEMETFDSSNGFQIQQHSSQQNDNDSSQNMEEENIQDTQIENHPVENLDRDSTSMKTDQQSTPQLSAAMQTRILQFRHYTPRLRALKHTMVPPYDPSEHMEWINAELMTIVEEGLTDEKSNAISDIQQRKLNWDNRRDLEPAVTELKRRTRVAINKLIKEKIAKLEAENEDEIER
jgi:hypothetical protein